MEPRAAVIHPVRLTQPQLPLAHYEFQFSQCADVDLGGYAGSAWRGVLGHALRRTVCVMRDDTKCTNCLLYRTCAYSYIFESPPPRDTEKMRRYSAVPHPYLLDAGEPSQPGGPTPTPQSLKITLFGRANNYLPYLIHAIARGAMDGVGRGRAPLNLIEVRQSVDFDARAWRRIYEPGGELVALPPEMPVVPRAPASVTFSFLTPLRLIVGNRIVTPERLAFSDVFGSLLRRVSMLSYFHTDTPLDTDFAKLTAMAKDVSAVDLDLRWYNWSRYSSRQHTSIQMGGLLGTATFTAADLAPFWPYIWLGQWTHAGKGSSMGLGRYVIDHAASLPCASEGAVLRDNAIQSEEAQPTRASSSLSP